MRVYVYVPLLPSCRVVPDVDAGAAVIFAMYDWDRVGKHDFIGEAKMPLHVLSPDAKEYWYGIYLMLLVYHCVRVRWCVFGYYMCHTSSLFVFVFCLYVRA
jgi:C2 domain-containing protein